MPLGPAEDVMVMVVVIVTAPHFCPSYVEGVAGDPDVKVSSRNFPSPASLGGLPPGRGSALRMGSSEC